MAPQQHGRVARLWSSWVASAQADLARLGAAGRRARRAAASVGPGWREALIAACAYGLYSLVRGLWGGSLEEGRRAAAALIDLEKTLGIYVEPDLQRFFVDHHLGMPFWNAFYVVSQVIVLPLTLFLVYRYRRGSYAFVRDMAFISWTAGVIWYALQPVAPPRLLASGFTDTVSDQTFFNLDSSFIRAFYNPVAAMPSLHVGMAPVVAWALIKLSPWLWTKVLGWLYPLLVATSIVVTGNHFILDIAGGLAVVLPAAAIAAWIVHEPRQEPGRVATAARNALHGGRDRAPSERGPAPRT